tara:strand:- start:822 stop:1862 length:1041 start_codon:yes stop_codon:yes gene_type:complete
MSDDLIKELCNTPGVPGFEQEISKIVLREIENSCVAHLKDPMGNLIFQVNDTIKNAPVILIDAHMDEVGFLVSHIEENGMIRVIPLGGIDPKLFYGQRLTIWGKKKVEATVAAIPPHISDKSSNTSTPVEDCLIDCGISFKKLKSIIKVGDQVTFSTECIIDNDRILSKSLDDRIGLYVLLETVKKINKKNLKCNLFASASVQEEMGLRGARIINSKVRPDFSIALEGTVSNDLPGIPPHKKLAQLGNGPEIRISDKYLIADRFFNKHIENIARNKKIKYQLTAKNAGGTNSTAFQVTGEGSKATVMSVPVRYLHSPSSVCLTKDVQLTIKLLTATIQNIHRFKDE